MLLVGVFLWHGCVDATDPMDEAAFAEDVLLSEGGSTGDVIGDVLPGTDPAEFAEGEDAFAEIEVLEDGLGPLFNDRGCGACHTTPVMGGSGEQIERRFGRVSGDVFFGYDQDPENHGGTLRQLFSNATFNNPENGQLCTIPVEEEPADANVNNVGRRTQPLFGLGLVDAMPDEFFEHLRDAQPYSVRGVVQRVPIAVPDIRDPLQAPGALRVGRFGWKGGIPSLTQFSADAYTNEMGITTQSCFQGQTIVDFAFENLPNGQPIEPGCNGGDLAPAQPAHADVPEFADDVVGPCDGGLSEIQDDVVLFTVFMERLAPPPRDFSDMISIERGEPIFEEIGCADCHVTTVFETPPDPFNGVPGGYRFQPFSDFLLHDMGSLGDGIGETGDPVDRTRLMRTQPLWGARFNNRFLHDGSAPDIRSAILAHAGQGEGARIEFEGLESGDQHALIQYIRSL